MAQSEGADPLPRRPDAWLRFTYCAAPARGGVGSARNRGSTRGDGERAVAALVASVERMKRRRDEAMDQESASLGQVIKPLLSQ
eukprot:700775-Prorocentrum_minimum.AAC.1